MTASLSRVGRSLLGVAVFAVALGVWEAWARSSQSFAFPPVSSVLRTAWHVWPTSDFMTGVLSSLERLAVGFALGALIGIGLGLLMGSWQAVRMTLEPFVEFARATPVIAIVPVAMVVLGFGDAMQISVIAFVVCFPILVNTIEGVRAIPPEVHDTASMLHVGPLERTLRINLPCALPSIAAGLRVGISFGLIAVVISEFVGENQGLGNHIWLQYTESNVDGLYAGILFLGLLGVGLNQLFLAAERRLLAWHEGLGDHGR